MISIKKRLLTLGLLIALLGIGNVLQAYKITIKNRTDHKINYSAFFVMGAFAMNTCGNPDETKKTGAVMPKSKKAVYPKYATCPLVWIKIETDVGYNITRLKKGQRIGRKTFIVEPADTLSGIKVTME